MTNDKVDTVHNDTCTCEDCKCRQHDTIGKHRDPALALPPTGEQFSIHAPDVGHRPEGQTIHD